MSQAGREVYFRKAGTYVNTGTELTSFARVADITQETRDEIAIGYIPNGERAILNPTGSRRISPRMWSEDDIIICLADEK